MTNGDSFGTVIKKSRLSLGITQRVIVKRLCKSLRTMKHKGIGVSYLSKIEKDRLVPPSNRVIKALAVELHLNEDDLLAIAGRAPDDVNQLLIRSPGARRFFQRAKNMKLSEDKWEQLIAFVIEGSSLAKRSRERKGEPAL